MAELLTFKTERKRRKVVIDGIHFEMLDHDEIDLAAGVRLRALIELTRKKELSEDEARKISAALKEWMPLLLKQVSEGESHLERLSEGQRIVVLGNFLKGSGTATPSPALEPLPA